MHAWEAVQWPSTQLCRTWTVFAGSSSLEPYNLGVLMAPSLTGSVTLGNLSLPCVSWGLQCYLPIALLGGLREIDRKPLALDNCDLLFYQNKEF